MVTAILLTKVFGINIKKSRNILVISAIMIIARITLPHYEILNISDVLWFTPFFMLGIFINCNEKFLEKINKTNKITTLIVGCILLTISIYILAVDIRYTHIINLLVNYLLALIGIAVSILFCNIILRYKNISNKVLQFSRYTYSIYLLHKFSLIPARVITLKLGLHYIVCISAMFILGIIIPILICKFIDKNKTLSNSRIIRLIIGY